MNLTGSVTTSISKDDFNEEVDFLGAGVSFSSQGARMNSLSKYFEKVLGIMVDGALNPVFTQEEFDSQKDQLIENIKRDESDVASIFSQVQGALVYGKNHPKGEFTTQESAKGATLDDIQTFYNYYYKPNNAYLIVIGDVKFKAVKKLVKKHFSDWEKGTIPNYTIPEVTDVPSTEIDFIDMPHAVQSNVSVTNTILLKKSDPDFYAALLANRILGGGGVARLNQNLRETNGFTYAAYLRIGNDHQTASRFNASSLVRNEVTDSAVVEFLNEIKRIRMDLVSVEELSMAKAAYVGSFVRAPEQPSTVAGYALNIETENLPVDYYENYFKNINAVSIEDVNVPAKKYFKADNLRIIIVGKGADVIPSLEKLPYTINYFDKEGNPTEKPVFSKPIPEGVTAQTAVDKYIDAIGGKEKASALQAMSASADVTITGVPSPLSETLKVMAPNKESLEMSAEGMGVIMKQKFNETSGYSEQQGMKMPMGEDEILSKKNAVSIFPELHYDASNLSLESIVSIEGEDAFKIKVTKGESSTYRFYNVESGLLVRVESEVKAQGQLTTTITDYLDYSSIGDDGIIVPYTEKITAGQQVILMKITTIKINEDLTDADFE
jgi:zinc protease